MEKQTCFYYQQARCVVTGRFAKVREAKSSLGGHYVYDVVLSTKARL